MANQLKSIEKPVERALKNTQIKPAKFCRWIALIGRFHNVNLIASIMASDKPNWHDQIELIQVKTIQHLESLIQAIQRFANKSLA